MKNSGHAYCKKKINEMFRAYLRIGTVRGVARACNVSPVTVMKYRDREGWVKKARLRDHKVEEYLIEKDAKDLTHDIEQVDRLTAAIYDGLMSKCDENGRLEKATIRDFAALIMTKSKLMSSQNMINSHGGVRIIVEGGGIPGLGTDRGIVKSPMEQD